LCASSLRSDDSTTFAGLTEWWSFAELPILRYVGVGLEAGCTKKEGAPADRIRCRASASVELTVREIEHAVVVRREAREAEFCGALTFFKQPWTRTNGE
jgi:hypothetical protein